MTRKLLDLLESAKDLCQDLRTKGYLAYFAGGYVRDFLMGNPSGDIDIATDATPEIISSLFPKTIDVGRSFGVMVVIHNGYHFEVSTFRKDRAYKDGRHPEGVDFSSPKEDALRRDFTINGLFLDPLTNTIYDYVEGKKDLKNGLIRAIGDPEVRFDEDKLRMIRAVRFSVKFHFPIEEKTKKAICHKSNQLLASVSIERIWQELEKMQKDHTLVDGLLLLNELTLLQNFLPQIEFSHQKLQSLLHPALRYPKEAPTICTILLLFPQATLEEKKELCTQFKLSRKMIELTEFFHKSDLFFLKEQTLYDWAYFYAHPLTVLYMQCKAATLKTEEREKFLQENEERQKKLNTAIERIRNHTPVVKAKDLEERGIKPGKEMGKLLTLAERIAINENLESVKEVLARLKI